MANDDDKESNNNKLLLGGGAVLVLVLFLVLLLLLWKAGVIDSRPATLPTASGPDKTPIIVDMKPVVEAVQNSMNKMGDEQKKKWEIALPKFDDISKKDQDALNAMTARIQSLQTQIKDATEKDEKNKAEELEKWKQYYEQKQIELKKQIEDYKKAVTDAANKGKDPPGDPGNDPSGGGAKPPPGGGNDDMEAMKKILQAGAVALCIAQPELCWIGAFLDIDLGMFGKTEHREAVLNVARKMMTGQPLTPEDLKGLAAAAASSKDPEKVTAYWTKIREKVPPELRREADASFAPVFKAEDDKNKKSEDNVPWAKALRQKLEAKPQNPADVLSALPQSDGKPIFRNDEERRRAEVMCQANTEYLRYWDEALRMVPVSK